MGSDRFNTPLHVKVCDNRLYFTNVGKDLIGKHYKNKETTSFYRSIPILLYICLSKQQCYKNYHFLPLLFIAGYFLINLILCRYYTLRNVLKYSTDVYDCTLVEVVSRHLKIICLKINQRCDTRVNTIFQGLTYKNVPTHINLCIFFLGLMCSLTIIVKPLSFNLRTSSSYNFLLKQKRRPVHKIHDKISIHNNLLLIYKYVIKFKVSLYIFGVRIIPFFTIRSTHFLLKLKKQVYQT